MSTNNQHMAEDVIQEVGRNIRRGMTDAIHRTADSIHEMAVMLATDRASKQDVLETLFLYAKEMHGMANDFSGETTATTGTTQTTDNRKS